MVFRGTMVLRQKEKRLFLTRVVVLVVLRASED